ncbi:MAG: CHAT domain-containing protein [Bacteroidia bacterium]|nr:CHAT domain-containing protein [Bacteroidia bacterium]
MSRVIRQHSFPFPRLSKFIAGLLVLLVLSPGQLVFGQRKGGLVDGDSLLKLALILEKAGKVEKSAQKMLAAERYFQENKDCRGLLAIANHKALLLLEKNAVLGAEALLEASRDSLFPCLEPDEPEVAFTYLYLGRSNALRDNWLEAEEYFENAASTARRLRMDSVFVAVCLAELMESKFQLGNFPLLFALGDSSVQVLNRQAQRSASESLSLSSLNQTLARASTRLGDHLSAEKYLEAALSELQAYPQEFQPERARICLDLAECKSSLGNFEEELQYDLAALKIRLNLFGENSEEVAQCRQKIGQALAHLGRNQEGIASAGLALNILEKTKGRENPSTGLCQLQLAQMYGADGNLARQGKLARAAARNMHRNFGAIHAQTSRAWLNLAAYYAQADSLVLALAACQHSIMALTDTFYLADPAENPVLKGITSWPDLLSSLTLKGQLLQELGRKKRQNQLFQAAWTTWQVAFQVIDSIRIHDPGFSEGGKYDLYAAATPLMESSLSLLGSEFERMRDPNYLRDAFRVCEYAKALQQGAALEDIRARINGGVPDSLLARESQLRSLLALARQQLEETPLQKEFFREVWEKKAAEWAKERKILLLKINREFPEYFQVRFGRPSTSLQQVRKSWAMESPGALLIEYFWGEKRGFALGITSEKLVFHSFPLDDKFKNELLTYRQAVSFNPYGTVEISPEEQQELYAAYKSRSGNYLFQTLIQPVLNQFGKKEIRRLYLIPDGDLTLIPFEALLTENSDPNNPESWNLAYLVREYPISYQFSGWQMVNCFPDEKSNPKFSYDWVALGNRYAPRPEDGSPQTRLPDPAGIFKDMEGYFEEKTVSVPIAWKDQYLRFQNEAKVLFLYANGVSDRQDAADYFLYWGKGGFPQPDSTLSTFELYNRKNVAGLVILASCEPEAGFSRPLCGGWNMSRAFQFGGAQTVMFSHWEVDPNNFEPLLEPYFTTVLSGKSKDVSLWNARNKYLNNSNFHGKSLHPYFWASFISYGNTQPLDSRSLSFWQIILIIAGILVGIRIFSRMGR